MTETRQFIVDEDSLGWIILVGHALLAHDWREGRSEVLHWERLTDEGKVDYLDAAEAALVAAGLLEEVEA